MLRKRIIVCLDVRDGEVVKGVQFVNLQHIGNPSERPNQTAASLGALRPIWPRVNLGLRCKSQTVRGTPRNVTDGCRTSLRANSSRVLDLPLSAPHTTFKMIGFVRARTSNSQVLRWFQVVQVAREVEPPWPTSIR